jgi:hypothetical protein
MPNGRWAGSPRKAQLPGDWAQRCQAAREIYGTACYLCGHPGARDTDHVRPGGNHSVSNLRPACGRDCPLCHAERRTPCHLAKSSAEGGRAAQAAKPRRQRPPEPHPGLL